MTVEILIPSYNRFESLQKCVAAIRQNTDIQKYCISIGDDASTDPELIKWLECVEGSINKYTCGIKIYGFADNLGFTGNVNRTLEIILSRQKMIIPEYIMLLNNDAYIQHPQWLEHMMGIFDKNPQVGVVATGLAVWCKDSIYPTVPGQDKPYRTDLHPFEARNEMKREFPDLPYHYEEHIGFWGCIIRTELFYKYGLFHEGFQVICQDLDWCWRIGKYGWKIAVLDEDLIYHQGHTHCDLKPKAEIDAKCDEDNRLIREIWREKWN